MSFKQLLENMEHHFEPGGKYAKYYALFEAAYTLFYTPGSVTRNAAHVRDAIDLKRMMIMVWLAVFPAMFWGMYNVGNQSIAAIAHLGTAAGADTAIHHRHPAGCFAGSGRCRHRQQDVDRCCPLPAHLPDRVLVGGFWEVLFAMVRKHEINEGFFVTSILFALIVPPELPLWQAATGITFGVVLAKEVFGGTGKNFLNPALAGRAFLFFAYPGQISGDAVWVAVDGYSGATALSQWAQGGQMALINGATGQTISWMDAFLGNLPGSIGEVSTLMILIGAAMIVYMRIASAHHRRCDDRHGSDLPAVQRHRFRYQPHVQHAVALASGAGRLRLWYGLHGDRSGLRCLHQQGQVVVWRPDRGDGGADPGGEPRLPGRHDAGHSVCQPVCPLV